MRELTNKEIEGLSNRTNVRKIAVENFLSTLTNNPSQGAAIQNLRYDARIYKWNVETFNAIMDGITIAGK